MLKLLILSFKKSKAHADYPNKQQSNFNTQAKCSLSSLFSCTISAASGSKLVKHLTTQAMEILDLGLHPIPQIAADQAAGLQYSF